MKIELIRKSDKEVFVKEGVKEVKENMFGNILIIFENDKRLTLQKIFFDIKRGVA